MKQWFRHYLLAFDFNKPEYYACIQKKQNKTKQKKTIHFQVNFPSGRGRCCNTSGTAEVLMVLHPQRYYDRLDCKSGEKSRNSSASGLVQLRLLLNRVGRFTRQGFTLQTFLPKNNSKAPPSDRQLGLKLGRLGRSRYSKLRRTGIPNWATRFDEYGGKRSIEKETGGSRFECILQAIDGENRWRQFIPNDGVTR